MDLHNEVRENVNPPAKSMEKMVTSVISYNLSVSQGYYSLCLVQNTSERLYGLNNT